MKTKIIVVGVFVSVTIVALPIVLNQRRVSIYEARVSHILSFKTEHWYLPNKIPQTASNIHYDYTEGWGQGGSSNTLKFSLGDSEAQMLRARIVSENSSLRMADTARPIIVNTRQYEELVWTEYGDNHGSSGGVWFDPKKNEFIFHHYQW